MAPVDPHTPPDPQVPPGAGNLVVPDSAATKAGRRKQPGGMNPLWLIGAGAAVFLLLLLGGLGLLATTGVFSSADPDPVAKKQTVKKPPLKTTVPFSERNPSGVPSAESRWPATPSGHRNPSSVPDASTTPPVANRLPPEIDLSRLDELSFAGPMIQPKRSPAVALRAARRASDNGEGAPAISLEEVFVASEKTATTVAFLNDGTALAVGARNGAVRIWTVDSGQESFGFRADSKGGMLAFASRGYAAAIGPRIGDRRVQLYDLSTGLITEPPFPQLTAEPTKIALSNDGAWLAIADAGRFVRVYTRTGEKQCDVSLHRSDVQSLQFSADGKRLASGDASGLVVVTEVASGQTLRTLKTGEGNAAVLCFSPRRDQLWTGGYSVSGWDLATGEPLSDGPDVALASTLLFSPDGELLLIGSATEAMLYHPASGSTAVTLPADTGRLTAAAFSFDGSKLATASDRGASLWKVEYP
ncbi:WD domain, G-beta repeat [Lignipirellula cremea]|uniref:WD domain, G-beta repeat n=2 Tax=Lignipirellula cremea TaxID=2528010 RepID=A0A518DQ00_9BACT|nr:WD domain, G-beta repeat [Lignipirellula cremea]